MRDHLGGEVAFLVGFFHPGQVLLLDPVAHMVADLDLVFAKQAVDLVEIDAGETGHVGSSYTNVSRARTRHGEAEKRRSIGARSVWQQTGEAPREASVCATAAVAGNP